MGEPTDLRDCLSQLQKLVIDGKLEVGEEEGGEDLTKNLVMGIKGVLEKAKTVASKKGETLRGRVREREHGGAEGPPAKKTPPAWAEGVDMSGAGVGFGA
eukprot:5405854-Alexandrium_andersonii.AAC.1